MITTQGDPESIPVVNSTFTPAPAPAGRRGTLIVHVVQCVASLAQRVLPTRRISDITTLATMIVASSLLAACSVDAVSPAPPAPVATSPATTEAVDLHCEPPSPTAPNPPLAQARTHEQRYLDLQQKILGQPKVMIEQAFPRGFDAAYVALAPGAVSWMANHICHQVATGKIAKTELLVQSVDPENLIGTSISAATGFCALLSAGSRVAPESQDQIMRTCPQFAHR